MFAPSLASTQVPSTTTTQQQQTQHAHAQVEIDKPLGLKFAQSKAAGGGLEVTGVSGNAAKSGIKVGDTVIYTSSFFGDELWPADKLAFSQTAITRAPSPVCLVYVKGANEKVNVKRLPKKAAPPRFGRKLTARQRELASHICVDCGERQREGDRGRERETAFAYVVLCGGVRACACVCVRLFAIVQQTNDHNHNQPDQ